MKRILFTGAPGTGKTSVIQELEKLGYSICSEKARQVIKQELKEQSNPVCVPWNDVLCFSMKVLDRILSDKMNDTATPVFFDRGIPDLMGYLNLSGREYDHTYFSSRIPEMEYSNTVFLFPVWEEIYANDLERKESLEQAFQVECHIRLSLIHI